ncbi:eukaryotic translation initiation factor 3 subunit J-like [Paramacrobiotus metropolitanus]|uniref:eukaryotic translation initiation factor 3 subunit J-like n=1 Tax=Paramacrobiotus metropolitanus TaxID=2943436 RepID=UPI0024456C28|nr:eukaryotic translation initiation factor 3 subunit J-like [Paramacrobiotus metropolitanus]
MANKVEIEFDDTENLDLRNRNDEDDDDNVKDNWDDESEDEEAKKPPQALVAQDEASKPSIKKKSLKEKIAEKDADKQRQAEMARLKLEEVMNRTPQEIAAEKARIRKEQEDSDFDLAKDTFVDSGPLPSIGAGVIDAFDPSTAETFEQFRKLLVDKIQKYQKSQFYPLFLQGLFQDLSLNLNSEDVRKCGSLLTTLAGEKAKKEKETAGKGKAKTKGKTGKSLIAGKKDDMLDDYGNDYDPIDDLL